MNAFAAFGKRAGRFAAAGLLGVCLAGGARTAGDPGLETPPPAAALREVFGVSRGASEDDVFLNDGTRATGAVLNATVSLRTAYGLVELATTNLAGIEMAGNARLLDVVVAVNGSRFSGFLELPEWSLRVARGATNRVRSEKLRRLLFQVRPGEAGHSAPPLWFHLRNGDGFAGTLRGDALQETFTRADPAPRPGDVVFVQFLDGPNPRVRLGLRSGQVVGAIWPGEEMAIETEFAGSLKLYWNRLDRIELGGPGQPTPLAGSPVASPVPPPGGQSIPGFAWIPPGRFVMGSPVEEADRDLDEGPPTEVTLTHGFWMGVCEVTQAEYKAVTGANPSRFLGDPQRPVERVTWREAMDYCVRLNQRRASGDALPRGYAYRLPTEAEWEYACRAGTNTRFSFGDDLGGRLLPDYAWFGDNSDSAPHPVGTKTANAWGLHDLPGNVLEWCLDAATGALPGGRLTDYRAPESGSLRIARGGSWLYGAKACRSANRDSYGESTRCADVGFRVVLAPTGD